MPQSQHYFYKPQNTSHPKLANPSRNGKKFDVPSKRSGSTPPHFDNLAASLGTNPMLKGGAYRVGELYYPF